MYFWYHKSLNILLLFFLAIFLSACATQPSVTRDQATVDYDLLLNMPEDDISYNDVIRPIFDKRCVVCHGCYDAPCQLKLSSFEGLQRGASETQVYDGARFRAIEPSRLNIDAKNAEEWRERGFHSILNEGAENDAKGNLDNSVLYQMLRLKQLHPQPRVRMISDDVDVSLGRKQVCTSSDNFAEFASKHPLWGMPYAMPNLNDEEYGLLVQWIAQGTPGPEAAKSSPAVMEQIQGWEVFLNGSSLKQQLVSRYLYEHLFQAHIHFNGSPDREFYRLVRSTTPSGQTVAEIPTVRPYDDPGSQFYYRLLRYDASIVVKDHVVYEWSDQRMQRYRELFIKPDYVVSELPGFEREIASNPFRVFEPIPPISRYEFLLDDARFFIEGFIKGPVCRGQIALNVIEDQFWVFFTRPRADAVTLQPEFLDASLDYLDLPAERGDNSLKILTTWRAYLALQKEYLASKDVFLEDHFNNEEAVLDINDAVDYIWNGDGKNPNAALTVFRHFDSASVSYGLVGDYPETAWVIDYPLLERIHYLLVAGFNVFGNVTHQLTTRLYMDFLRMEAENQFLLFTPMAQREQIRDTWYAGMQQKVESEFKDAQQVVMAVNTVDGFETDDPQRELYQILENHFGTLAGPPDIINRCSTKDCLSQDTSDERRVDEAMQRIASMRGEILSVFPDVSFIRVRNEGKADLAYTVILNKGYANITSMFANENKRDRSQDTLTVLRRLEGSYPNFFFDLDIKEVDAFVARFESITTRGEYEKFVGLYGLRRTNTGFWAVSDWFQDWAMENEPLRAGIFDLNRYRNR